MFLKTQKYLKSILTFLLFSSLVTPLIFSHYFFYPFITTKVLFFRLLVLVLLILFSVYFFLKKKIKYSRSYVLWGLLVLFVISLLATIFGVNPTISFWGNMERADGLLFFICLLIYGAIMMFVFGKDKKVWHWFFRTSLLVGLIASIYGLLQYFDIVKELTITGSRISSTLGNPAYLGSYMLLNVFLSIYLFINSKNIWWKV